MTPEKKWCRRWNRAIDNLAKICREMEAAGYEDVNLYLEDTCNFNLLVGPSHSATGDALFENVFHNYNIPGFKASGGGW